MVRIFQGEQTEVQRLEEGLLSSENWDFSMDRICGVEWWNTEKTNQEKQAEP